MIDVEINDIANVGLFGDPAIRDLAPEALTAALNVRMEENKVRRIGGRSVAFTPSVLTDPCHLIPVRGAAEEIFWIFLGLAKATVFASGVETEITNAGGDYTTDDFHDWNHTFLSGVPVLTNFSDPPQYWPTLDVGTPLDDLPNWPVGDTTKLIRTLGPFLFGLNNVISSANRPHSVRWSHPADPGSMPSSWDFSDETKDAGVYDLPDAENGIIQEGRPLRGLLYVYKDNSTWQVRFVGGRSIFSFDTFLESSGILAPRCVATTGDGKWHFVVTQSDVIVHNGQSIIQPLAQKFRRTLFNQIDSANFRNSFVFCHPNKQEMWFCYPEQGETFPTRALVWNYGVKSEVGVITEVEIDFFDAARGDSSVGDDLEWDEESSLEWDDDDVPWNETARNAIFVARPNSHDVLQLEVGEDFAGTQINASVMRESQAILGKKRSGEPIVDYSIVKFVRRVWPRLTGGPVEIRLGVIDEIDGSTIWSDPEVFDPTTDKFVDFEQEGIAISIEIRSLNGANFEFSGYKLELRPAGRFDVV